MVEREEAPSRPRPRIVRPKNRGGRPRGIDHTRRQLRVDLSDVDDATARHLLSEFDRHVSKIAAAFLPSARRLFHPVTYEELHAIGQTAVLEAYVTYEGGASGQESRPGTRFAYWVCERVRWRCSDYVQLLSRGQPPQRARVSDAAPSADDPRPGPDEAYHAAHIKAWLRNALGELPPRQRAIVVGVARGETKRQLAAELGISRTTVHHEHTAAIETLREQAAAAGLDGTVFAG